MVHPFQPGRDHVRLQASVSRRSIVGIFHYTYLGGLPSIFRSGGLLSRANLHKDGTEYKGHGYGRPGKEAELCDYIFCSLVPPWGMMGKEEDNMALLEVSPRLIWREGTIFCPNNSAFNEFSLKDLLGNNTADVFDTLFPNPNASWPTNLMAEIMVRDMIPAYDIIRLHFLRGEDKQQADHLSRGVQIPQEYYPSEHIKLAVTPRHFPRHMRPSPEEGKP